jgi:hypothetical protein
MVLSFQRNSLATFFIDGLIDRRRGHYNTQAACIVDIILSYRQYHSTYSAISASFYSISVKWPTEHNIRAAILSNDIETITAFYPLYTETLPKYIIIAITEQKMKTFKYLWNLCNWTGEKEWVNRCKYLIRAIHTNNMALIYFVTFDRPGGTCNLPDGHWFTGIGLSAAIKHNYQDVVR